MIAKAWNYQSVLIKTSSLTDLLNILYIHFLLVLYYMYWFYDLLQIIDKSSSQKISQICGNTPPQSHISISNEVQIRFKTGPIPMGLGFNIYFKETQNG